MNLKKQEFICLDCESTGLDTNVDRIVEIALVKFTLEELLHAKESLINPECPIPETSFAIHHISDDMVKDKPKISEILPEILKLTENQIIVGHGIRFDIDLIVKEAERAGIPCKLQYNRTIDTLRLARHYGESPINSLEQLRKHFNIVEEGAHRAMNDVVVNIDVFKYLAKSYRNLSDIFEVLSRPVTIKIMPFGKYKGRLMTEVPLPFLQWAANKDFDQDLLFTIRSEIKRRKKGTFETGSNPFNQL